MIDAYTIGITIALEDGVSAGVAAIQQDLLALDRAIQATAAGLLALRRLGQQTGVIGSAGPAPASSHAPASLPSAGPDTPAPDAIPPPERIVAPTPSSAPVALPDHRSNASSAVRLEGSTVERPPLAPDAGREAPQPRREQSAGAQPTAPRFPFQTTRQNTAEQRPFEPRQVAEFAPRPIQEHRVVAAEFAPHSIQEHRGVAADPPPPPAPQPDSLADPALPPPPKLVPAAPIPAAPAAPSTVRRDPPQWPVSAAPKEAADSSTSMPRAAPLLAGTPEHRSVPAQSSHQAPGRWNAASPFPPPEAAHVRLSGDVILDGSRLGRWISDSLTRMAERVPSGSTGFDPRAGVGWPAIQAD